MLKILVVEDNPVYAALLKNKLTQVSIPLNLIGVTRNIAETLLAIAKEKPDVLLLDIDLQSESSFELFDKINFKDFQIIFATAHENYAISAFDVEAVGYLLKPVIASQLEKFLTIAEKNVKARQPSAVIIGKDQNIKQRITNTTISVPSDTGFDILQIAHIIRCEALNSTTQIYLENKKKLVSSYNLGKFYDLLMDRGFYQVHRSHIINLSYVKKYLRSGIIIMMDDIEIPVSKNNRNEFIAIFSTKDV